MFRHLIEIMKGKDYADDSKCLHLAHICANAMFLICYLLNNQQDLDDRYKVKTLKKSLDNGK